MRPRIADSWVPPIYVDLLAFAGANLGAGAFPAANRAQYVPIIFPYPAQLYSLTFIATNGTGNYDLGFYDGYSKNKIQSTGSTAMSAAGAKTMTFTSDYRVDPGKVYYAALAGSSTSGQCERNAAALGLQIAVGVAQEASALPLPSSMTPVTLANPFCPLFVFGIR